MGRRVTGAGTDASLCYHWETPLWRRDLAFLRTEMSQIITEPAEPAASRDDQFDPADEFAYRPVPPLAPISLFLGFCALSGFVGVPCLAVGGVGVIVGALALWQIRRAQGDLGGRGIALLGVGLSSILLVA